MLWFEALEKIAPLTVVTAVALFVVKEIWEALRRYRSRARKAGAIRTFFIEEMEFNNWAIKSLRSILKDIESRPNADSGVAFVLRRDASGKLHYRYRSVDGTSGGMAIPNVHRQYFDKFLPELAEVDELMFEQARRAYEKISQLEHIRTSLIANLAEEDPAERHLDSGFTSYAFGVLDEVEERMTTFHVFCCGKPLEAIRLR